MLIKNVIILAMDSISAGKFLEFMDEWHPHILCSFLKNRGFSSYFYFFVKVQDVQQKLRLEPIFVNIRPKSPMKLNNSWSPKFRPSIFELREFL